MEDRTTPVAKGNRRLAPWPDFISSQELWAAPWEPGTQLLKKLCLLIIHNKASVIQLSGSPCVPTVRVHFLFVFSVGRHSFFESLPPCSRSSQFPNHNSLVMGGWQTWQTQNRIYSSITTWYVFVTWTKKTGQWDIEVIPNSHNYQLSPYCHLLKQAPGHEVSSFPWPMDSMTSPQTQ